MSQELAVELRRERAPIVLPKATGYGLLVLTLAVMAGLPLVASTYMLTLMVPFFAFAIALLGFNLLFGYTGLLSFGHAMFLAIGAYTTAAMTSKFGILYFEAILLGALVAALIVAIPVGLLCVRYTKIFFGMLTLAFGMLLHSFLFKFYDVTGGDQGMRVIRPLLFGVDIEGGKTAYLTGPFYYYSLGLLAVLSFVMWRIVQSPFGLHLKAIRENEQKAAYLGVRIRWMRLAAFVISALYGAVGGSILAISVGLADPEMAYWTQSGNLVFMAVLGGSASFAGPVVGALGFVLLQDEMMSFTEYWRFVMGAVLVLIVIFFPRGLTGIVDSIASRLRGGA